jgi:hypothetical protein
MSKPISIKGIRLRRMEIRDKLVLKALQEDRKIFQALSWVWEEKIRQLKEEGILVIEDEVLLEGDIRDRLIEEITVANNEYRKQYYTLVVEGEVFI